MASWTKEGFLSLSGLPSGTLCLRSHQANSDCSLGDVGNPKDWAVSIVTEGAEPLCMGGKSSMATGVCEVHTTWRQKVLVTGGRWENPRMHRGIEGATCPYSFLAVQLPEFPVSPLSGAPHFHSVASSKGSSISTRQHFKNWLGRSPFFVALCPSAGVPSPVVCLGLIGSVQSLLCHGYACTPDAADCTVPW